MCSATTASCPPPKPSPGAGHGSLAGPSRLSLSPDSNSAERVRARPNGDDDGRLPGGGELRPRGVEGCGPRRCAGVLNRLQEGLDLRLAVAALLIDPDLRGLAGLRVLLFGR